MNPSCDFLRRRRLEDPGWRSWAIAAADSEALEHIDEPARVLEDIKLYLAPGRR